MDHKTIVLDEALGTCKVYQRLQSKVATAQLQLDTIQTRLEELDKEVYKHSNMLAQAATCIRDLTVTLQLQQEIVDKSKEH